MSTQTSETLARPAEAEIKASVREFISRAFRERELEDHEDFMALGFGNSLFAIRLVEFVESEFDVEIDSEDLHMDNFRSINAVTSLVGRKQEGNVTDAS